MVATIDRSKIPTGPDGNAREPTFVRNVDANGNDIVSATAANQTALLNGATATTRLLSAAGTPNATNVKASAGSVTQISGYNASTSARYLKLYDKATAPTIGTDTPRKTYYLPPGTAFVFDNVGYFATGIGFGITTAAADADTGALTAGDIVCLNLDYL